MSAAEQAKAECEYCQSLLAAGSLAEHKQRFHQDKLGYDCPACDKGFETERGVKVHHKKKHNESIADNWYTCQWCGERHYDNTGGQDKYCSQECYGLDSRNRVEVECNNCGEVKEVRLSTFRDNDHHFCNLDCRQNYRAEFDDYHPRAGTGASQFRGDDWQRQRKRCIQRDDEKCQRCGMTRAEHFEEYGRDIDVHHEVPYRKFDESRNANLLSNLVTLCRACHHEAEMEVKE